MDFLAGDNDSLAEGGIPQDILDLQNLRWLSVGAIESFSLSAKDNSNVCVVIGSQVDLHLKT
jgi:hypothetical protein